MNKLTLLGIGLLIISGLLVGFQAISSMMTAGKIVWKELTVMQVIGTDRFDWVDGLSMAMIKDSILYVIHLPLYIVLAALGLVIMILGGLTSR